MQLIDVLLELAENGALFEKRLFTTTKLSKKLGVTQQTISNELVKLQDKGIIDREPSQNGIMIQLTPVGIDILNDYKNRLNNMTQKSTSMLGRLVTGLGEGKFYIQQEKYSEQIKDKLKIKCYPGTLNIEINKTEKNKFLNGKESILIEGFKTKNRTFGSIKCYPIKIGKINAAVIIPERTHHSENIIELISGENLREKLKLKDGDQVKIHEKK